MLQNDKIPIVVGVTGHRNIVDEDITAIKAQVIESLTEIQNLCKGKRNGEEDTPVIMLNAFAQGADMLCAEAALDLGIEVYAVLPCKEEKYKRSFDLHQSTLKKAGITSGQEYEDALAKDEADKKRLDEYLSRVRSQGGRVIYSPDIEKNKAWIKKTIDIDDESYEYRQLGIYMAEHSHVLIALWDGKPPQGQYGCGTVEVIKFALEHKFLDKDKLFCPGMINDSAVIWIKSRRQGDGAEADIKRKWLISNLADDKGENYADYSLLDNPPVFLKDIILKTVKYNAEKVDIPQGEIKLWETSDGLDEYRKNLKQHYSKADALSYAKNQTKYNRFILFLAIIGTIVAGTFLIYDDASLPYMIFPCTIAICVILFLTIFGNRKAYHKKYIEYRAFAEALRIQFYTSMCLTSSAVTNVCDLYAWSQKVEMVWIEKAINALEIISDYEKPKIDTSKVIDIWIGNNEDPEGQLKYHNRKKGTNKKKANLFKNLSKGFQIVTVAIYFIIFIFEIVACILKACDISWFWESNFIAHVSWRNFAAIVLGTATVGSLLASSYWGKLSYDRKADDNEKMSKFYASAFERWNEVKGHSAEIERFVKEIAREELVENGIWCSYMNENGLEINI
ncbi:MAG: DUF4231 domain-containing protein [Clostridia bacterium]|nr:DUF4231 domain-containing protein [Clostridia bacterium]